MLTGAHILIMSSNASADSAFLRDVVSLPHVDAGEGFLIFGLPPAEVAMHEAEGAAAGKHELFLMCADINEFVSEMAKHSVTCDPVAERGWGSASAFALPSGLKLGVYQSHHARPVAKKAAAKALQETAKAVRKATKKDKKVAKKVAKKVEDTAKKTEKKTAKKDKKKLKS